MTLASAWDTEKDIAVVITSVYGGKWLVQPQGSVFEYTVQPTDLRNVWIDSEIIDTFDDFVNTLSVVEAYFVVSTLTQNVTWAQYIAQQWAELY